MYFDAIASMCPLTSRANAFSCSCLLSSLSAAAMRSKLSSGNLASTGSSIRPARIDRVDAIAALERVLQVVGVGREPVAQEVLEQELAEAAARLGRPQRLLELAEVLRALDHLRGRLRHLAEPVVDLRRRLCRRGEPRVQRLLQPLQAELELGVPRRAARSARPRRCSAPSSPRSRRGRKTAPAASAAKTGRAECAISPSMGRGNVQTARIGRTTENAGPDEPVSPSEPARRA